MSKQFAEISFRSESKLDNISSPVASYNIMNSPDQKITMVESQITKKEYIPDTPGAGSMMKDNKTSADKSKISGSGFSAYRSPSESESSAREGYAKYGTGSMADSSRLTQQQAPQSTIYQSGYNVSTSQPGLNPQYQTTTAGYKGTSAYEVSSSFQSGTSSVQSGMQSSTYQSGTSGTYQQGAYQPGTSYQQGAYQPQPYQGSTSSNLYGSSSLYKSGYQPPKEGGNK